MIVVCICLKENGNKDYVNLITMNVKIIHFEFCQTILIFEIFGTSLNQTFCHSSSCFITINLSK